MEWSKVRKGELGKDAEGMEKEVSQEGKIEREGEEEQG